MAAPKKAARLEKELAEKTLLTNAQSEEIHRLQDACSEANTLTKDTLAKADELQRELNRVLDHKEIAQNSLRRSQNENLLLRGYLERINEDERMAENRCARRVVPTIGRTISTQNGIE